GIRTASSFGWETLYCGYRYENTTGLFHVRNRVYHPMLGSWLQRDLIRKMRLVLIIRPIAYQLGVDTISSYRYAFTSPLYLVDPSGLACKPKIRHCVDTVPCDETDPELVCEAAEELGAFDPEDPKQKGQVHGVTICCNGKKFPCVLKEYRTQYRDYPGITECIVDHEKDHFDDVDCPASGLCQPDWKPKKKPEDEECAAFKVQLKCLVEKKAKQCGALAGNAKSSCESVYDNELKLRTTACKKNCLGDEEACDNAQKP
ncbi:MAG: hypothetical protein JNM43_19410, partial [Planctomycetaceae bacterium]|nr:hypothetical protein [Planctomycetaceae bacterium]